MTLVERLAAWASSVRLPDVPDRVVALAESQVLSQLAAARAGLQHPLGQRLVAGLGQPFHGSAAQSAYVLAGLTSWLHFDDTAYAGHLSNSTATVPLSYAHALDLDGEHLLTAVVVANECAARIAAAATLGRFRGQNAAHTHVAGAVAGRLAAESAPAQQWVDALGLAFSLPPYPLLPAFLSSDAKTLSASVPVRLGLDACDAAAAGLRGHAGILEDPDGFLARFATVPLPEAVDLDLGVRWHTDSLSFKVHPGGPGLDAAVDCASELVSRLGVFDAGDVASVVVETSLYTIVVEQKAGAFVDGPGSPVHALVFHTPYAVATTLLTGRFSPADLAPPLLDDGARWALAARVRIEHDEAMTRESLRCEVPFGEAVRQAGPRAAAWLSEVGGDWLVDLVGTPPPPSPTFDGVAKRTPARVVLTLTDGSVHTAERSIPVGATGDPSREDHAALMRDKWRSVGGDQKVADLALSLRTASSSDVRLMLDAALPA